VARDLQAAHTGHLDVEQKELRAAGRHALNCLQAMARLADELGRHLGGDVGEELLQPFARRLLIVGDEDTQAQAASGR
jgi:hypothetical protein